MSIHYKLDTREGREWGKYFVFGKARGNQPREGLNSNFDSVTLGYLSEEIINHICDSLVLNSNGNGHYQHKFNDYSFLTAPAYKSFEGYLFQIAKDLDLPSSGNKDFIGTYFDEVKIDKAIDKLLKELELKTDKEGRLSKPEKEHIKDMVKEMKRFLRHYRHTPAHFHGERIDTYEKAQQNIMSMYRIINETTKTLLRAKIISIKQDLF